MMTAAGESFLAALELSYDLNTIGFTLILLGIFVIGVGIGYTYRKHQP